MRNFDFWFKVYTSLLILGVVWQGQGVGIYIFSVRKPKFGINKSCNY